MDIKTEKKGSAVIVTISYEVDMSISLSLSKHLKEIAAKKPPTLIMDLSNLTYIDSSGIGAMVECFRQVNDYKGAFCLAALNEKVKPIFEVLRLDKVFTIYPTLAEALRACKIE